MAVLTTPTTQTVYGSIIDQSKFQKSGAYVATSPVVYLTRILCRMMAAVYSQNSVLSGLEVVSISGLNTTTPSFTISPGFMIIDSTVIHFNSQSIISTDPIPNSAPNMLRVGIFAEYTFNAAAAEVVPNDVKFTSYLFDINDSLVAPTLFGGGEKILLASLIIDTSGASTDNIIPSMRIFNWSNLTDGTIHYIGNGVELRNSAGVGAEVSRTLTGLVSGTVYRVQMLGYGYSQVLIGNAIGDGSLLSSTGIVDATFTATSTTAVITLVVNSNVTAASAKFIGIKIYVDNYHVAKVITPANSKASNGNLKALSVNNPSKTIKTEIAVAGHGTFKVRGDSKIIISAELQLLDMLDASVASWVTDIPKMKPAPTTMAYGVTGILF